jgi:hypothetical protein
LFFFYVAELRTVPAYLVENCYSLSAELSLHLHVLESPVCALFQLRAEDCITTPPGVRATWPAFPNTAVTICGNNSLLHSWTWPPGLKSLRSIFTHIIMLKLVFTALPVVPQLTLCSLNCDILCIPGRETTAHRIARVN